MRQPFMAGPDDEPTFLGALRVTNGALSSSFRLDVGCLDHLGPFHEFDLDVLGELFRGARDRFEAKYSKPLPDVGQRHDLDGATETVEAKPRGISALAPKMG